MYEMGDTFLLAHGSSGADRGGNACFISGAGFSGSL